jgi:hypothetical protein
MMSEKKRETEREREREREIEDTQSVCMRACNDAAEHTREIENIHWSWC